MNRKSKWIVVESPEQSATEVARQALERRLLAVWRCMPLAVRKADEDTEYVHQMRVASRRAMAALEAFEVFLPKRRAAWFKRQMRRVRKAGGPARDLDVLGAALRAKLNRPAVSRGTLLAVGANGCCAEPGGSSTGAMHADNGHGAADLGESEERRALENLIEWIAARRDEAQAAIVRVYRRLSSRGYKLRVTKLLTKIRERSAAAEPSSVGQLAARQLTAASEPFLSALEADLTDIENLHELRIVGKRLRYVLEIFAGALTPAVVDTVYPQIAEIQEQLGHVVDDDVAIARYQQWRGKIDDERQRLVIDRLIDERLASRQAGAADFLALWAPSRRQSLRGQLAPQSAATPAS